jgi:hypothetical protein
MRANVERVTARVLAENRYTAYHSKICSKLHCAFDLMVRFCGDTAPPYTSKSPLYSTLSTVNVLFKTSDLSGLYQGWYSVMPPDGFYDGFQLCFKIGIATLTCVLFAVYPQRLCHVYSVVTC